MPSEGGNCFPVEAHHNLKAFSVFLNAGNKQVYSQWHRSLCLQVSGCDQLSNKKEVQGISKGQDYQIVF